jgi:hypothetical protein
VTLNDPALVVGANAIDAAITHFQLHSGARGASGTTNVISIARVAVNGSVDADGDITWTNVSWTGLTANQTVAEVSYWSSAGTGLPPTGGTYYGGATLTGDTSANSAGEFTITSVAENGTAT